MIGFKTTCYPNNEQKNTLSQWIGCQRVIKNSKIAEWKEQEKNKTDISIRIKPNQKCAQFSKDKPFLKEVPSQILRNGAYLWNKTLIKSFKGECGRPQFQKKSNKESVLITKELFRFVRRGNKTVLILGTKKFPVGGIAFDRHELFNIPNSIVITREKSGKWSLSFCHDDGLVLEPVAPILGAIETLDLDKLVRGYDRGVVIPFAGTDRNFEFTIKEKSRLKELDIRKRRHQRRASKCKKGGKNKKRWSRKKAKAEAKAACIRNNFAHHTSRAIVDSEAQVIVFENLKLKNLTASAKGTLDNPGRNVKQKAGLNKALLGGALGSTLVFTKYKAKKLGKFVLLVDPKNTSRECPQCGHIHPDNRKNQSQFLCVKCGHTDNADRNAAFNIENRARKIIRDLGTGLTLSETMEIIASVENCKSGTRQKRTGKISKNLGNQEGKTKITEE